MNPEGPGTAGFADRTEGSVSDSSSARSAKYADIAQLVEQRPFKAWVGGSIELRYDCHRQSLVLFIRCAEHHPLSAPSHGGCSQAVRQRIVVPPIAGSIPVIYPTWNRSSVGIRAAASMPEATAKRLLAEG